MRCARDGLSQLAAHDDSKVLMTRAGAHEVLLDVVDRDGDLDDEDLGRRRRVQIPWILLSFPALASPCSASPPTPSRGSMTRGRWR